MKLEALHIGLRVRHPQYGVGVVKTISEATAEIQFDDGKRTVAPEPSGLEAADARAAVSGLDIPLAQFVQQTVAATLDKLEKLDDAEKIEMQQYITRCYGSMTTFNILFKEKTEQF